jgi:hypothetical protein
MAHGWNPWPWLTGSGAVVLGGLLKHAGDKWVEWRKSTDKTILDRDTLQDASSAALRDDLIVRLQSVEVRIDAVQADADQWRQRYWTEVEAHTLTRIQNTQLAAQVRQLQEEQTVLRRRHDALAEQLATLQITVEQAHPDL